MSFTTSSLSSTVADSHAIAAAPALATLTALYLVSGATAQLGANGVRIEEGQWHALEKAARDAHGTLLAHAHSESDAIAAFRRLSGLCEQLLARRAMGHPCPSGIWRDLARAGRDAYEQLDT